MGEKGLYIRLFHIDTAWHGGREGRREGGREGGRRGLDGTKRAGWMSVERKGGGAGGESGCTGKKTAGATSFLTSKGEDY